MSDTEVIQSQVVKDTIAFNEWFDANVANLMVKAKAAGLETKLREIMRLSWKKCSDYKNNEMAAQLKKIEAFELELKAKDAKYDALHLELQKITNRLIKAEKNAR